VSDGAIVRVFPLGFPWEAADPFLFIAYHDDRYPPGNERMGPAASLAGRNLGMDFEGKDGWRMYHGEEVPGFPQHPHRGFETVTIVRRGVIDHSDSLGAVARFGHGDVQWITAGKGIVHSEMFPLLDRERENPLELFQIWLNLPRADKLVDPHFSMLWKAELPVLRVGRGAEVVVVAGGLEGKRPPPPPPRSWASRPEAELAIWTIALEPGGAWTMPPAAAGVNRTLYLFRGGPLRVAGTELAGASGVKLRAEHEVELENGPAPSELLLLQARPIGEPVAQHGPFVMTTRGELQQAYADYQRTRFGGWPWPDDAPVLPREEGRFARHPDGRVERAGAR
jgi:redox-sensitive bicupin YhaK (pirin superfamily)